MVCLYLLLPLNESYTDDTDVLLYIYASKQFAPSTVFYHKEDPVSKDHMFVANISTVSNWLIVNVQNYFIYLFTLS